METNDSAKIENILSRLLDRVVRGSVFGLAGGIATGIIGGIFYWLLTKYFYRSLYGDIPISQLIWGDILLIGIPVGLLIGISTGLHAGIFRKYSSTSMMWILSTGIGVISAIWLSGFSVNNSFGFFLEVVFISSVTSWSVFKLVMQEYQSGISKQANTVFCSISNSLFTFITVYGYFRFWVYLQNIPS